MRRKKQSSSVKEPEQKNQELDKVQNVKSVSEMLLEVMTHIQQHPLLEAINKSVPWLEDAVEAGAQSVGLIKCAMRFLEFSMGLNDPIELMKLACRLAYHRSIQQAAEEMMELSQAQNTLENFNNFKDKAGKLVNEHAEQEVDYQSFDPRNPLTHLLIQQSDELLRAFLETNAFSEGDMRRFLSTLHVKFSYNLVLLLSDQRTSRRFEPLFRFWQQDQERNRRLAYLRLHAEHEQHQFNHGPVFNREVFSLNDIYIELDCGQMTWGEITGQPENSDREAYGRAETRSVERKNPFKEEKDQRKALWDCVKPLLFNSNAREPIVIQGVAGSGKSTFTRWLTSELTNQGLYPVRIRFLNITLNPQWNLFQQLERAVFADENQDKANEWVIERPNDLFLNGELFKEQLPLQNVKISPIVLILDGWDELSISLGSSSFKEMLKTFLDNLKRDIIGHQYPIRLILTGRPSADFTETSFLNPSTPILTIWPLTPERLEQYTEKVRTRLVYKENDKDHFQPFDKDHVQPILEKYRAEFIANEGKDISDSTQSVLSIMSYPLLAQLALRLLSAAKNKAEEILQDRTSLYRNLISLTCYGAKYIKDESQQPVERHLKGAELRRLLRYTALIISITDQGEYISGMEMTKRLNYLKLSKLSDVEKESIEHTLSRLFISFYFKTGYQEKKGGEFMHKSFREYLFAEGIVELLKDYDGKQKKLQPDPREHAWQDFKPDDPRKELGRQLALWFCPRLLTREVQEYLRGLLRLEVWQAAQNPEELERWIKVRDGLKDSPALSPAVWNSSPP